MAGRECGAVLSRPLLAEDARNGAPAMYFWRVLYQAGWRRGPPATRRQCLFHHPSLLRDASSLPSRCDRALFLCFVSGNDCYLMGSVHLRSKWTPIRGAHFASMALIYTPV